jgi:hypothetical protein
MAGDGVRLGWENYYVYLLLQEAKGRSSSKGAGQQLQQQQSMQEMLRPLVDEQKNMNQKIAKLNHSIEVF